MNPLISEQYRLEQVQLHAKGNYGTTGKTYGHLVSDLVKSTGARSLLDYGCGSKQSLRTTLVIASDVVYEGYDPAVPEFSDRPIPSDIVCCIDVLEHIEPHFLGNVLSDLAYLCEPFGFFTIHTGPAQKVLSDGRNAHLIQEGSEWWLPKLREFFEILAVRQVPSGFCVMVKSLNAEPSGVSIATAISPLLGLPALGSQTKASLPAVTAIDYQGHKILFNTPNEMTVWRVKTIFTKEPDTIRWLETIPAGSILLDVGANVGMYSLFAAVARGASVFSFEPESQNYALLNANIAANSLSAQISAYPLALSDEMRLSSLHLAKFEAGSSCHSFGEEVGFDLKPRASPFAQGSFSVTIDQLVESGALPCPNFIKIDVDGIEHKVLAGAKKTLSNPKLKSIIVELNTHLKEHLSAIESLTLAGFVYEQTQAEGALRKSGAFEGVGEFIFTKKPLSKHAENVFKNTFNMSLPPAKEGRSVLRHISQRVQSTKTELMPFPHLVVDDVFPKEYYQEVIKNFPTGATLRPIGETGRVPLNQYKERHTVLFEEEDFSRLTPLQNTFWREFASWMYTDQFVSIFLGKFSQELEPRFSKIIEAEKILKLKGDALIVSDKSNYAIGPHTDAAHRLVSFLFYLPQDDSMRDLGTSVYRPKNPNFTCWGGPHYSFDEFERVKTIEFVPNRLVVFPKTEISFHGVEKIQQTNINRPLLINNIRLLNTVTH